MSVEHALIHAPSSSLASPLPAWVDRAAWPFAPRFASVPGGRLHYVDEGPASSEPLVLVHGTPTWSFEWRHVVRALSPRVRCLALDHLGFGLSQRPSDASYTPEAHAERFAGWVDAVGLRRFTLVVHDFGGPIALPFALAHPERVARLVVLNSFAWPLTEDPDMARVARLAGTRLFRWLYRYANASLRLIAPSAWGDRKKLTPAIQSQYLAPFRDRDGRERVLWALARAMAGSSAHYALLRDGMGALAEVPSMLLWGLRDSAFKPAALERWRGLLPHAQVVTLEGAGHWPHEEEPGAVCDALRAFLARD